MGPQLYRCGNKSNRSRTMTSIPSLQWGRNFIVAEMREECWRHADVYGLQWGRNFIVAEITPYSSWAWWESRCFNGAATLSLRKSETQARRVAGSDRFNGAATLSLRKLAWQSGNAVGSRRFNGAATLSLRKFFASTFPFALLIGFNGAATLSLRKYAGNLLIVTDPPAASMGPQLYRCGNLITSCTNSFGTPSLQWGRNFIVAEI